KKPRVGEEGSPPETTTLTRHRFCVTVIEKLTYTWPLLSTISVMNEGTCFPKLSCEGRGRAAELDIVPSSTCNDFPLNCKTMAMIDLMSDWKSQLIAINS
ncbi:hypothetical protein STEG23_007516, partial [Scotinomys teguina]